MRTLRYSARATLAAVVDLLFPRFCLGCSRRLPAEGAPLLLCPICHGRLERIDPRSSCLACLRPLPLSGGARLLCISCRRQPPPFERLIAPWRYAPPLDRVIRAMKFARLDFLAGRLVEEALGLGSRRPEIAAIVPVPMPLLRRLERGFNQAERIGRALASELEAPCLDLLRRPVLGGVPQRRLGGSARRDNRELRFECRRSRVPIPAGALLLVDDVVTTGSTLRAAARSLSRRQGAATTTIVAWAIAATPPGDPICAP